MFNDGDERDRLFLSENPVLLETEFEDGTNVRVGTDFILCQSPSSRSVRLSKHSPLSGWERRLERTLNQLVSFREIALPVGAVCEQSRTPGFTDNGHPTELRYQRRICSGNGSSLEFAELRNRNSYRPLAGEFAFLEPTGEPLVLPDGSPVALRLGMRRIITLFEPPRKVGDDREMHSARLLEQLRQAGDTLLMLPAEALRAVWKHHGEILGLPETGEYRWIDAVFEHSWTRRGSRKPLTRGVFNRSGHGSLILHGDGLFPRPPLLLMPGEDPIAHQFPTEAGNPFTWCSVLDDLAAASIDLLDWLIDGTWKVESTVSPSSKPLRVIISYAHEDENFVERLKTEIRPFERSNDLELWYDRELIPGMNLDSVIDEKVESADIFVFILSSYFLASDYCTGRELVRALERANAGQACVIGIHARPCNWTEVFPSKVLLLPTDSKAVIKWRRRDDAWLTIATGLKRVIDYLSTASKPWTAMVPEIGHE